MRSAPSASQRWFRRLLSVFPKRFRERNGAEMELLFRDQLSEVSGHKELASLWISTLRGAFRTAPEEHLRILVQDARWALRGMRKNLGLSLVAILTLTLGIGANSTVFSVVNAILLRPLPFANGDRLVRVYLSRDGARPYLSPSGPLLYDEVRESASSFESIVAQRYTNLTVELDAGTERIAGLAVTEDWLEVLGVTPALGRGFSREEEALGMDAGVALVSHGFWTRRLGASAEAVGSHELLIDSRPVTVIGVLPRGFHYPYNNEIWMPMNLKRNPEALWGLNIQAVLRDNLSVSDAAAELLVVSERVRETRPEALRGHHLLPVPTRDVLLDDNSGLVLALLAAVGFVLLLVSVNIGNLLLARSLSRRTEVAVRSALGASRLRQARQTMTESLMLASFGGLGGLVLAFWARGWVRALVPGRMGYLLDELPLDTNVIVFTVLLTVLAGFVFGVAPAWRATGRNVSELIQQAGRGTRATRSLRSLSWLVVGEIALSLVVLAGAGAMIRNYRLLSNVELGYDASRLLTATVPLDAGAYTEGSARARFVRQASARLEALPGVVAAGATCLYPSPRSNFMAQIIIEGRPVDPDNAAMVNHRLVSPEFFDAVGISVRRGRAIAATDREGAPLVAVIGEATVARYFPGEDPIGQRIRGVRGSEGNAEPRWVTVVGVVSDVYEFDNPAETWYLPYAQHADENMAAQAVFVARTAGAPEPLFGAARAALASVDASLPLFDLDTVESLYQQTLSGERSSALFSTLFAVFALLMAALGIGGVMAYAVSERRHELGLRIALGARPADILLSVLGQGARWTLAGVCAGAVGATLFGRFATALLPDAQPVGLAAFSLMAVALVLVALAACYLPARRAIRVDPLEALRSD